MIALHSDCLIFQTSLGENVPSSVEAISVELLCEQSHWIDEEFVRHAARAVLHYFRHELGRQTVSVAEFAQALENVLQGFAAAANRPPEETALRPHVLELDLCRLARESGTGCELFFFPRLRDELRRHLKHAPRVARFRGLRCCVKRLAGTRRWTPRCRQLEERIVDFLRECLRAEATPARFALVVE